MGVGVSLILISGPSALKQHVFTNIDISHFNPQRKGRFLALGVLWSLCARDETLDLTEVEHSTTGPHPAPLPTASLGRLTSKVKIG